jgi:hypothetical protein
MKTTASSEIYQIDAEKCSGVENILSRILVHRDQKRVRGRRRKKVKLYRVLPRGKYSTSASFSKSRPIPHTSTWWFCSSFAALYARWKMRAPHSRVICTKLAKTGRRKSFVAKRRSVLLAYSKK